MIPKFFNEQNVSLWGYTPNFRALFEESAPYRKEFNIRPAESGFGRTALLLIDVQNDFCHPSGTLYVAGRSGRGAMDDNVRLAQFIYREMRNISLIISSLDTHLPFQVFTPSFFIDQNGKPLMPHDMIDGGMHVIRAGVETGLVVEVNPRIAKQILANTGREGLDWLNRQVRYYCKSVARRGNDLLYIWPEHCIDGSVGHALTGLVHEAVMFHAYVRDAQNVTLRKGDNPLSECYSIFGPLVRSRCDSSYGKIAKRRTKLIRNLLKDNDRVIIAGQALSHCVRSSVDDLLVEVLALQDERLARKIYLLEDCCSPVVVPGVVDYTDRAEEAIHRYREAGVNIVSSLVPTTSW